MFSNTCVRCVKFNSSFTQLVLQQQWRPSEMWYRFLISLCWNFSFNFQELQECSRNCLFQHLDLAFTCFLLHFAFWFFLCCTFLTCWLCLASAVDAQWEIFLPNVLKQSEPARVRNTFPHYDVITTMQTFSWCWWYGMQCLLTTICFTLVVQHVPFLTQMYIKILPKALGIIQSTFKRIHKI